MSVADPTTDRRCEECGRTGATRRVPGPAYACTDCVPWGFGVTALDHQIRNGDLGEADA